MLACAFLHFQDVSWLHKLVISKLLYLCVAATCSLMPVVKLLLVCAPYCYYKLRSMLTLSCTLEIRTVILFVAWLTVYVMVCAENLVKFILFLIEYLLSIMHYIYSLAACTFLWYLSFAFNACTIFRLWQTSLLWYVAYFISMCTFSIYIYVIDD